MLSFIHILLLKLQCLSLLSLSFIVYLSSYNLYLLFSKYFFSVLSPILSSHSLPLIDCSIISSFHFISDHLITIHSFTYHLIYIHFISGKLGTIVQITVCQSTVDPRRIVIFANTHLFFHPAAAFARLLQTDVIISTCMYVRQCIRTQGLDCFKDLKINGEEIIEDYNDIDNDNGGKDESEQSIIMALKKLELGNGLRNSTPLPLPLLPDSTPVSVSIMLLGDLNSTPETAVIEYFKTYVHTRTCPHMHTHTHAHTHTHTHAHTHTHTHAHTHTHTPAHRHRHTHTHTHY